jgi:uncharacterized protein (TIGR03083 family)
VVESYRAADLDELVAVEQARFVALAREVDASDWSRPSWCAGWTVADVIVHTAAHLHGGQRDKRRLAAARRQPRDVTIAWLASDASVPSVPLRGVRRVDRRVQLGELVIHRHDITGALELPAESSRAALVDVLEFGTSRVGSIALTPMRRRARGLRLVATDIDWSTGSGDEVCGPAAALIMGASGRPAALASLTGPGVASLTRRIPSPVGSMR